MNNETKAENMLLDKKWTRKRLITRAVAFEEELANERKIFEVVARMLSKGIGDHDSSRIYHAGDDRHKRYNFDEAIDRVGEIISQYHEGVCELQRLAENNLDLERSAEGRERILETTIEERNRAQEAVALVGATFNDYREANAADKMVSEYERIGEVEHWSIGSKDEASRWASRQCCKPI